MAELTNKQKKKMGEVLGISTKILDTVVEDLQKMELLRHIKGKIWEVFDGSRWHKVKV